MATILQPVRGTRDLIGEEATRYRHIVDTARRITALFGFSEWQTPIFEDTKVFSRTLGDTSDVVTKEMYTFQDRGGDAVTLRPEGTAGICRALLTASLTQTLPQKAFYAGPMFRYERPQKGRYRQFHQIGVELLGFDTPLADAEVIACGWSILCDLKINDKVELNINTLGDAESRDNYRAALVTYFSRHINELSPESRIRLEKNPLRILDSKNDYDQKLVANAPVIYEHLSNNAEKFYRSLEAVLQAYKIPFKKNPRIVRGLDYYNHTAFEFVTNALGSQGTVLAGGRYDGLVEQMGGPSVPGVGWAAGIERLSMLIDAPLVETPSVMVVAEEGTGTVRKAIEVVSFLRDRNIKAEIPFQRGLKNSLKYANRMKAKWAILTNKDILVLKNLDDGSQTTETLESLAEKLA